MIITKRPVISNSLMDLLVRQERNSVCLRLILTAFRNIDAGKGSRILSSNIPGNYFTYREKEGMISYMPKTRQQVINDDKSWKREGRQAMKPARWVRSMINPRLFSRIKDTDLAIFATIVKVEEQKGKLSFRLVSPSVGYDMSRFKDTRIESCMWNDPVGPFYDLFGAKVVVAISEDGRWVGRAIFWPKVVLVKSGKEISFMDRIYTTSPEISKGMEEHAKEEGWWHKSAQSRGDMDFCDPHGMYQKVTCMIHPIVEVDLANRVSVEQKHKISYWPYLDTFQYGGKDWISNQDAAGRKFTYADAQGRRQGHFEGEVQTADGHWMPTEACQRVDGHWYPLNDHRVVTERVTGAVTLRTNCITVRFPNGTEEHFHRDRVSMNGNGRLGDRF